jgi:DNA-binding NarL/FixJ family response regulator
MTYRHMVLPDTCALYTTLLDNAANHVYSLIEFETPQSRERFHSRLYYWEEPMDPHFDILQVEENSKLQKIRVPAHGNGPRLLIADDHAMFAEILRAYLQKTYRVVGVVANGRAMVAEAGRLRPEVIVVDVGMPLLNGLDAARRIKEQAPNIKFVFLTMRDDRNLAAATLELGPVGFVLKHSAGQELLHAIDHVLHGKPYLTAKLKAKDWVETKARAQQFSKEMTPRQREILQLHGEGRSIKEIASLLDISKKTVEFHKHHIQQSFDLRSNADMVLFAVKQGLISLTP